MTIEHYSLYNFLRNITKVFIPNQVIEYQDGDVIYLPIHFCMFFKVPKCKVKLLSIGYDQNLESFVTKDKFIEIINDENILEWVVNPSSIENNPKLRKVQTGFFNQAVYDYIVKNQDMLINKKKNQDISYVFDIAKNPHSRTFLPLNNMTKEELFVDNMSNYKYIFCAPGHGMCTGKVVEAVACGCVPIVCSTSGYIDSFDSLGIQYISIPCIYTYYHLSRCDPVDVKSIYVHKNKNVQNSLELLKMPVDWTNYRMTYEEAEIFLSKIQNMTENIQHNLKVPLWSSLKI